MKRSTTPALPVIGLCAALAACAAPSLTPGTAGAIVSAGANRAARAAATTSPSVVYVSDLHANEVDVYLRRLPHLLIRRITSGIGGPNSLAVDGSEDLFVSNVDGGTVAEYPPGAGTPSRIIRDGLSNPLTLTVADDGTLYVVNYNPIGQGSTILKYPPGKNKPSFKIPLTGGAEGLALDKRGNLFVGYNGPSGGRVLEFAPKSQTGKDLGIAIGFAGGVLFDATGDLVVCDQIGPAIDVFPPGATQPSRRLVSDKISDPYLIAFDRHFGRLYVANSGGGAKNVYAFDYATGSIADTIKEPDPAFGVAVSPPTP